MIEFTNNASTVLASSVTATATTLVLVTGTGYLFPDVSGLDDTEYFYATIEDVSGALEIVRVLDRSIDVLTVLRGADGTTGIVHSAGSRVELRPTAAVMESFFQRENDVIDGGSF